MSLRTAPCPSAIAMIVSERLRKIMGIHFDPNGGSEYWLERARDLDFNPVLDVTTPGDLQRFGEMTPAVLASRPLRDFIPRSFHGRMNEFIVGKTGGTTGQPVWTAYRSDEFAEAFLHPFTIAAKHVGFPQGENWLYLGPSGPHIIGKVVRSLAQSLRSADPFSVDFDPIWAKRLPEGSFAQRRYLEHVLDQAMEIIDREEVGVLFTTPPVLMGLSSRMSESQRLEVRGIHYGGMAIAPDEMRLLQAEVFPNAAHISGYGNTLFGCCLELKVNGGRDLDYYPLGNRLLFEILGDEGELSRGLVRGLVRGRGRVRFTRLDESCLLINMLERDEASLVLPPRDAPDEFCLPGVRNPAPPATVAAKQAAGLY